MKRNHNPGFKNLTCSACGAKAHSLANSFHRRCTAQPSEGDSVAIRPKHDLIERNKRGRWQ